MSTTIQHNTGTQIDLVHSRMDKKEILRPNEDDQKRAFENDPSEYSQMNIGHTCVFAYTKPIYVIPLNFSKLLLVLNIHLLAGKSHSMKSKSYRKFLYG